MTAALASGAERERLWALVTSVYPAYEDYARRIGEAREIPLVVLTPRPPRLKSDPRLKG